jgi:hypothetical protein
MSSQHKSSAADSQRAWLRYAGLGIQLMVYLVLAVWGGLKVDRWLHCFPLLTALLPLLVLFIIFYKLVKETESGKPNK